MEDTATVTISLDQIHELLVQHGYEATPHADNVLSVKDPDSGIVINTVLEDNILFCTLPCVTISSDKITLDVARKLLDADNGISTSAFQLYEGGDDNVTLTLNNFCKLQAMGPDDQDDILSCLQFLEVDAYAARGMLQGMLS